MIIKKQFELLKYYPIYNNDIYINKGVIIQNNNNKI